jgi:hypothetical protein
MPEGYGDNVGLVAYWEALDYDVSTVDTSTNYDALRLRGSMYIDGTYERLFYGSRTDGYAQERAWPRTGVPGIASDEIPGAVVWASYEAAYVELITPGVLSSSVVPNQRITEVKAGTAGVKYADGGDTVAGMSRMYSRINGLLLPLLRRVNMPSAMVV